MSQNIEYLLQQMHENHLGLRRTIMGLMGSQRALLEQLYEHDLINAERWERDKIRYAAEYEQLAAQKDEEELQEKKEMSAKHWERQFNQAKGLTPGQPIVGTMKFHVTPPEENPDDDADRQ